MTAIAPPAAVSLCLSQVKAGEVVQVQALEVEPQLAAWLAAVGLGPGEVVEVLRRAALGGPLHLRRVEGGELALDAGLASQVRVSPRQG